MTEKNYIVVFQYADESEVNKSRAYWTAFKDEADFREHYTLEDEKTQKVIAQGVTKNQAIRTCANVTGGLTSLAVLAQLDK